MAHQPALSPGAMFIGSGCGIAPQTSCCIEVTGGCCCSSAQLKPLTDEIKVIYQHEQIDDREIQQTFKAETDASVTIDPSEVSAIQEISVEQLKDNLEHAPEQFTPWFRNLLKHLGWF